MSGAPAFDPADLDYAVRAILVLPRDHWEDAADVLVRTTVLAAKLHGATGRSHPALGNGTVTGTLSRWPLLPRPETDALRQAEALAALSRAVIRAYS